MLGLAAVNNSNTKKKKGGLGGINGKGKSNQKESVRSKGLKSRITTNGENAVSPASKKGIVEREDRSHLFLLPFLEYSSFCKS